MSSGFCLGRYSDSTGPTNWTSPHRKTYTHPRSLSFPKTLRFISLVCFSSHQTFCKWRTTLGFFFSLIMLQGPVWLHFCFGIPIIIHYSRLGAAHGLNFPQLGFLEMFPNTATVFFW